MAGRRHAVAALVTQAGLGVMKEEYSKIKERVERGIAAREFPGCVVGVVSRDGERAVYPFGHLTYDTNAVAVNEDTIYDLASVTKAIPGAALMMHLLDEGKIHLDDRLVQYVPDFGNLPGKDKVTLRHLLSYTLDLDVPPMSSLRSRAGKEIREIIISAPLKSPPGSRYAYTNSTAFFFHLIIEQVVGKKIDQLAEELFFTPLGMTRTTFFPLKKFTLEQIAPTEVLDWRGGEVRGVVHDESTFALQEGDIIPAVAGLFSTAPDLLNFAEMLLDHGAVRWRTILSREIIEEITSRPLESGKSLPNLGWERGEEWMGDERLNIFGKRGFTGTAVMVHPLAWPEPLSPCRSRRRSAGQRGGGPLQGKAIVILSNATYPTRPLDGGRARHQFRRDVANIVFG